MRYLYGAADEKFVKDTLPHWQKSDNPLNSYQFTLHSFIRGKEVYNKHDVPIEFKATPDTLVFLAAQVVDTLPLPSVFTWTNVDVLRWIRNYGYKHYQNTFRENLIHGRTLLLLDASALSAMNIKHFDEIRHIAYGIRCLFYFEMTKFVRSISLAPHFHYELYKLLRVKSGPIYENALRSELWRHMQLLREKKPNLSHWELLEKWLALKPDPEHPELFGAVRRSRMYRCKLQKSTTTTVTPSKIVRCNCMPPCECYWTESRDLRPPWRLQVLSQTLPPIVESQYNKSECKCMPPCCCHWKPKLFMHSKVLTCLLSALPHKYGPLRYTRYSASQGNLKAVRTSTKRSVVTVV